jgi:hypothetical protein
VGEKEDEEGGKAALYGSESLFGVKVMGRQQPTAQSKLRPCDHAKHGQGCSTAQRKSSSCVTKALNLARKLF